MRTNHQHLIAEAPVGVHTKMPLNVRNRVVSPTGIAERTASLEIRLKLQLASGLRGGRIGERVILIPCSSRAIPCSPISNSLFGQALLHRSG